MPLRTNVSLMDLMEQLLASNFFSGELGVRDGRYVSPERRESKKHNHSLHDEVCNHDCQLEKLVVVGFSRIAG